MATTIGRSAKAAISADDSSYTDVGKLTSISPDLSISMADDTNNDSAGWDEAVAAQKKVTLKLEGKYDPADAGQADLEAASFSQANRYFRFRGSTGVGYPQWKGIFRITGFSVNTQTKETHTFSCTVESSGAITKANQ